MNSVCSPQRLLAIDPGSDKCGIAVYDEQKGVMRQAIVSVDNLIEKVETWYQEYGSPTIIVGNRTASKQVLAMLAGFISENKIAPIVMVEEHKTTEEARRRYWQAHPPAGWRRLIPQGLLFPPCAIDDFAAIILAERYFQQCVKKL